MRERENGKEEGRKRGRQKGRERKNKEKGKEEEDRWGGGGREEVREGWRKRGRK